MTADDLRTMQEGVFAEEQKARECLLCDRTDGTTIHMAAGIKEDGTPDPLNVRWIGYSCGSEHAEEVTRLIEMGGVF